MERLATVDERRTRPLAVALPLVSLVALVGLMAVAIGTDPGPTGPAPTASTALTSAPASTAPGAPPTVEVAAPIALVDPTMLATRRGVAGDAPPTAGTGAVTVGELPPPPPAPRPAPTPTYYYVWPDGTLTPVADGLPPGMGPDPGPAPPSGPPTAVASSDD